MGTHELNGLKWPFSIAMLNYQRVYYWGPFTSQYPLTMAKAAVSAAGATAAKIAVLTASDRAAGGVYEDKSGPAVVEMLKLFSDPWS